MAKTVLKNPNYMFYEVGEQYCDESTGYAKVIGAWGYITSSGKEAVILFTPEKLLGKINTLRLDYITMAMRGINGNYLGGSTSYNPKNDSSVSYTIGMYNDKGVIKIILNKTSSWGFTNNTPIFGTITTTVYMAS